MAGPCSAETRGAGRGERRRGQARRRQGPARRGVQAAQQPLQLPGPRRGRASPAAVGRRPPQPEADVRGHGHQPARVSSSATPTSCRSARATCRTSRCCASSGDSRKPIMLKRGISATIEEWLLSAEYILAGGNMNVMLCERGIRTFESCTRNTLDISAIPVVQQAQSPADPRRPEPRDRQARQGGPDGARRGRGRRRRSPDRSP